MLFSEAEKEAVDSLMKEFSAKVIGQTVISVDKIDYEKFRFTLGNGTSFNVVGVGACCASGQLLDCKQIANTENVITSVKLVEKEDTYGDKRFSLFLLSAIEETIYQLNGSVNEGTGYYTFGWELYVE